MRKHSVVETADQETVFTAGWWEGGAALEGRERGQDSNQQRINSVVVGRSSRKLVGYTSSNFYINKRVIYKYLCCEQFVIIYKTVFVLLRRFHETFQSA